MRLSKFFLDSVAFAYFFEISCWNSKNNLNATFMKVEYNVDWPLCGWPYG